MKKSQKPVPTTQQNTLLGELRQLIEQARQSAAVAENASLTMMYWHIGKRVRQEMLENTRASYGDEIVTTLSRQLAVEYGRGFEEKNLRRLEQRADEQ